jgi:hypothetical protein
LNLVDLSGEFSIFFFFFFFLLIRALGELFFFWYYNTDFGRLLFLNDTNGLYLWLSLLGSENRKRAGGPGVGVRARESSSINQGLLSLGRVIKARTEKSDHVVRLASLFWTILYY